jgi:hypothetical protein
MGGWANLAGLAELGSRSPRPCHPDVGDEGTHSHTPAASICISSDISFSWEPSRLVDFSNLPQCDRYVETAERTSEGPIAKGSTWTHRRVQGRRRFDAPIRLAEYEQDRRFVMVSGSNGLDVRSTMTFDAHGDNGTRMVEVLEMRLSGLARLFEPMIRRQVPKQGAEVHERLKEVLEQRRS